MVTFSGRAMAAVLVLGVVPISCDRPREPAPIRSSGRKAPAVPSSTAEPAGKAEADGSLPAVPAAGSRRTARGPDGARVVLLGSGTPVPDPDRSGPAVAVIAGGRPYLVDFGPGVVRRAAAAFRSGHAELDVARLDVAFLTHLHSDHTAGYADLIFTPAVVGRRELLQVFGPPGTAKMTESLLAAYSEDMRARSRGKSGAAMRGYQVRATDIKPGQIYRDEAVTVTAFAVSHPSLEHAFGYRFDTADRSIVISGDTAPAEAVVKACDGCDLLVHEVYCQAGFDLGAPGWQRYHATHHTSAVELGRLAARARPRLLVLYHLLFFECAPLQLINEIRRGYRGPVVVGEDLGEY